MFGAFSKRRSKCSMHSACAAPLRRARANRFAQMVVVWTHRDALGDTTRDRPPAQPLQGSGLHGRRFVLRTVPVGSKGVKNSILKYLCAALEGMFFLQLPPLYKGATRLQEFLGETPGPGLARVLHKAATTLEVAPWRRPRRGRAVDVCTAQH